MKASCALEADQQREVFSYRNRNGHGLRPHVAHFRYTGARSGATTEVDTRGCQKIRTGHRSGLHAAVRSFCAKEHTRLGRGEQGSDSSPSTAGHGTRGRFGVALCECAAQGRHMATDPEKGIPRLRLLSRVGPYHDRVQRHTDKISSHNDKLISYPTRV